MVPKAIVAKKVIQDGSITEGGGNVFADLGFPQREAEDLHKRSHMMIALHTFVDKRGLTQAEAATHLNVTQQRISDLLRGKINRFSLDALKEMASDLD